MPRAFDLRQPKLDHSPLSNLLDFSNIDQTAELAGGLIKDYLDSLLDGIVEIIEDLTGLDLSALADLFHTLDLSSPAAFLESLIQALLQVPELIPGLIEQFLQVLVTLPDTLLQILDVIVQTIASVTGIDLTAFLNLFTGWDLSSPAAFINSLITHLTELPETMIVLIESVISGLLALPETLASLLGGLVAMLAEATGVDLEQFLPLWADLDFSDPIAFFASLAEALVATGTALLGPDSPLNSLNLFGIVPTEVLGQVPISIIGDVLSNLLTNPLFENLDSIASTVFIWDPTTAHSPVGGSAKVLADGSGAKDLLSNLIPVTQGQTLKFSAWTKYTSMVGSGSPIQLGVTAYQAGSAVLQPVLSQLGLSPATSDWRVLTGEWTVPANVDAVRMRMTLTPSATAGTLWWSDTFLSKIGLLPQPLVQGIQAGMTLADDLEGIGGDIVNLGLDLLGKAAQGDLVALMNTLGGSIGSALEDIGTRMESFLDGLSPLNANNINTGAIADTFVPGVLTIIDNTVTQLLGLTGSGFSQSTSASALGSVAATLTGTGSQVNRLMSLSQTMQSQIAQLLAWQQQPSQPPLPPTAPPTSLQGVDEFERSASNWGSNWGVTFPVGTIGTVGCDGHNATFNKGIGGTARWVVGRYIPLVTNTDIQVIRVTLDSAAEDPLLNGIPLAGDPAYNDVLGRVSADNLNFIMFRAGAGKAWLYRVVNGLAQIMFGPFNCAKPGPGAMLTLYCGQPGTPRYFEGRINGGVVVAGNEVGVASMMGAAYRRTGMGGLFNQWTLPFLTQSAPGRVRTFSGGDQ